MIHNNHESDQDSPLEMSGKSTREIKTMKQLGMEIFTIVNN